MVTKAVIRKRTRTTRSSSAGDKLSVTVYKAMKRDIIRGVHPSGEPLSEK